MRYAVGIQTNAGYEAERRYFEARAAGDREAAERAMRAMRGGTHDARGGRPGASYEADMRAVNDLLRQVAASIAGDIAAAHASRRSAAPRCTSTREAEDICQFCGEDEFTDCMCGD